MNEAVGKHILITAGNYSGQSGMVAYVFYRHSTDGFCQQEYTQKESWEQVFWVVPDFDHCGGPKIIEIYNKEFIFIDDKE